MIAADRETRKITSLHNLPKWNN